MYSKRIELYSSLQRSIRMVSYRSTCKNLSLVTVVRDFNYGSNWQKRVGHFEAPNDIFDCKNGVN